MGLPRSLKPLALGRSLWGTQEEDETSESAAYREDPADAVEELLVRMGHLLAFLRLREILLRSQDGRLHRRLDGLVVEGALDVRQAEV